MTPSKTIRKKCVSCMAGNSTEVKKCQLEICPLWYYRFGRKEKTDKKILTALKSIKAYCYECSTFNYAEVRKCEFQDCDLFQYRFGKNPKRKGIGGNINRLKKA